MGVPSLNKDTLSNKSRQNFVIAFQDEENIVYHLKYTWDRFHCTHFYETTVMKFVFHRRADTNLRSPMTSSKELKILQYVKTTRPHDNGSSTVN